MNPDSGRGHGEIEDIIMYKSQTYLQKYNFADCIDRDLPLSG